MAKRGPRKKAAAAGREGINEQPPVEDRPDEALPTLSDLAEAVASGEAVPGGELSEEEIAKLQPEDVVDLGVKPEDQVDPGPPLPPEGASSDLARAAEALGPPSAEGLAEFLSDPAKDIHGDGADVSRGTEKGPTETLRDIVQGVLQPRWVGVTVVGAQVIFCYREKKWRDSIALRADVDADGRVLIDLETDDHQAVLSVPFGDKVRNWKFRGA